jgi:hypothetical protein
MLRSVLLAASGWLATTAAASALAFTYTYQGHEMVQSETTELPPTWAAFQGTMILDERKIPGGSLRDATISFSFAEPLPWDSCMIDPYLHPVSCDSEINGLVRFDIFTDLSNFGTDFSFTTDADRRIVSWSGDVLGGPPDGNTSSEIGDSVFVSDPPTAYAAPPGRRSGPTPIPLPGAAGLLAAALGLLGALRLRRP